MKSLSYHTSEK